jgi:hypothetical protein
MRKLAMLTMAMIGLAFTTPSFAQGAQSAPQPGLPPGASIGAPNAGQPAATGRLTTTTTGAQPAPMAPMPAPTHHVVHIRHHYVHHHVTPVAAKPAPATTTPPLAK